MARSEELLTAAVLQRKVKAAGKAVPSLWKTFLLPIPMPTDRLSIEYRFGFGRGRRLRSLVKTELERAASLAGVEYGNSDLYPEKFGTLLGREFGGAELSGGQWQRIAIARGLYKEHDMIVLDEPTASIDPLEETRLYRMFARMAEGKTAFIVTHRIGSAQLADRILVFDKGKIVEQGTHEELIKSGGKYAFLYREQGKWY